jgi:class 3 adenylate cyclase
VPELDEPAVGQGESSTPSRGDGAVTRGFLFADLRGYTSFVESRGAVIAAELLYRYRAIVREAVGRHHGAEIKTEGDSFYVVFTSVSRAVECGLEIVAAAARASTEHPDQPIEVGIGIHAGETVETPEGYVGSAVNMAARLCSAAAAGEVLVSDTVRALTANTSDVYFQSAGRRRLKGIAEQVTVHRALAAGAEPRAMRPVSSRHNPIAVAGGGVVLVSLLVAVAALSGVFRGASFADPSASASTRVEATASAGDVTAIVVPSPDESAGPGVPILLPPGSYELTRFRPRTAFDIVEEGWRATHDDPDAFELTRWRDESDFDGYLSAAHVQVVNQEPCLGSETVLLDPSAHALIEWLQANPHVETTSPLPVSISGYAGLAVDVTQAMPPPDICAGEEVPEPMRDRVFLFPLGETSFWIGPDERIRLTVVDVGDRPVTFLVGSLQPDRFDEVVVIAQPVLDSLRITP